MSAITELYRVHRPKTFKGVLGQSDAVRTLLDLTKTGRVPHALLLTGPSGVGKTTLARILKTKLECSDADFSEVNCADFRGIDMVREIRTRMQLAPITGKCRIWLIDECHKLSGDAQNAFLKTLEDTPAHVYFILATTEPEKLLTTIKTRCTEIKLKALSPAALKELVLSVAEKEGKELKDEVVERLIEHSEGSARKVLVLLNAVIGLENEEEQLNAIQQNDHRAKAIELARTLLNPGAKWPQVAKLIKEIDEEPETLRHMVLAYMSNVMLGGGKMSGRAFQVADVFQHSFYESKRAGLVLACYAVTNR